MDNLNNGANDFNVEKEVSNDLGKKLPVQVPMVHANINRENLTDEQLVKARLALYNREWMTSAAMPRTIKTYADPDLPGQSYCLVSFIPSRGALPDSDGFYGILKVRGTFPTEMAADQYADYLIRQYDSFSEIDQGLVGRYMPLLADNEAYTKATKELDLRKKLDDIARSKINQKRTQEKKDIEEVQERQKRLQDPEHRYEIDNATDPFELYLELQVKKAGAEVGIKNANEALKKYDSSLESTNQKIAEMEEKHPEVRDDYIARYEEALKRVGVKNLAENELLTQMRLNREQRQKAETDQLADSFSSTSLNATAPTTVDIEPKAESEDRNDANEEKTA
jgi:hypothetical protein